MYYVTKEFTFDSAHRLRDYDGACARMHGHTYKLKVTLRSRTLTSNGMVIDFNDLKRIVKKAIVDRYDHMILNDVEPFTKVNPTAENMAREFFEILKGELKEYKHIEIESVKVWETPTSVATYKED